MAKFKVGDKVRIIGGGVETIKSVHPKGLGTGFGPREIDYYATRESDGFITDDDISGVANSAVRNSKWVILYRDGGKEKIEAPSHAEAKKIAETKSKKSGRGYTSVIVDDGVDYGVKVSNAKFKVGDVVRLRIDGGKHKYKVVKVLPDADAESIMGGYLVQKIPPYDPSAHGLDKNIGSARSADMTLANSRACNSTNAIVRKAMNACARNKAPEGWWEGKTIFAAFGWGKSVKGKVVSHKGGIIKLEDGTTFKETDAYDLYAINSCAKNGTIGDLATVKREIEQSLRKMADFATKFTGAKTTPSSALNDPMYSGYIELTFPTEEESANFNPYYLINKLGDDKSLLPRWAWGIYGFNYNRNGRTWRIKIGRFAT